MTDLDADAAAVRKGIGSTWTSDEAANKQGYREADAALDRLTARLQEAEADGAMDRENARAALARAEAAERERDMMRKQALRADEWQDAAEAAEAREAALREPILALKAEGWFAAWSDDPRVVAINAALATPEDAPKEGA